MAEVTVLKVPVIVSFTFRAYIQSVVQNLSQESNMMVAELFDKVREDLADQSVSSPVEFSLTSSPLPICINPDEGLPGQCTH